LQQHNAYLGLDVRKAKSKLES